MTLVKNLQKSESANRERLAFARLDPTEFYSTKRAKPAIKAVGDGLKGTAAAKAMIQAARKYDGLFETGPADPS